MAEIPHRYRAAVRAELTALVAGRRPAMMTWVRLYGDSGATLVEQPEDIWSHDQSEWFLHDDGSVSIELPLWTTDGSPSDLTAQLEVARSGAVTLDDVHVL